MARIKIKQLNERVATMGLHLGGGPTRRKLEPGEVVDVPEDIMDGENNLFDLLWSTGTVDLTRDDPTRPLDYESVAEAKLCSPSFKPHDPSEEIEAEKARTRVADRLKAQFAEASKKPGEKSAEKNDTPAAEKPKSDRGNRRALRRQALEMPNGEAATA